MKETFIPVAKRKAFQLMRDKHCVGVEAITSESIKLLFKDGSTVDISNYGNVKWHKVGD